MSLITRYRGFVSGLLSPRTAEPVKLNSGDLMGEEQAVTDNPLFGVAGDGVAPSASIVGSLDAYASGCIFGWACSTAAPRKRLRLILIADGVPGCTFVPAEFRQDVLDAGFGDGWSGFVQPIPRTLFDNSQHALQIGVVQRDEVVWTSQSIDVHLSHSHSGSAAALVGADGWLFLCRDTNDAIGQFTGTSKMSGTTAARWREVLEQREAYLSARSIPHLFIPVPSKELIYPELLPRGLKIHPSGVPLDHLLAEMTLHSNAWSVLDVRPVLLRAKSGAPIYRRQDSHWNSHGAFLAARAILNRLSRLDRKFRVPAASDFDISSPEVAVPGDLSDKDQFEWRGGKFHFLRNPVAPSPEPVPNYVPLRKRGYRRVEVDPSLCPDCRPPIAFEHEDRKLPRAVMFRTSSAEELIPFLSDSFSRIVYIWSTDMLTEVIEQEKPDFVLQQVNSRYLLHPPLR